MTQLIDFWTKDLDFKLFLNYDLCLELVTLSSGLHVPRNWASRVTNWRLKSFHQSLI